jgi:hypothetical protein
MTAIALSRVERDAAWWSLVLADVKAERTTLSPFESYAIARFTELHGKALRKMWWVGDHFGHLTRQARCEVLAKNSVVVQCRLLKLQLELVGRTNADNNERSSMQ